MKFKTFSLLTFTHLCVAGVGFIAGLYLLPIISAPESPSAEKISQLYSQSIYSGQFKKDLKGSDFLHWGEGQINLGKQYISLNGRLAPGPNYQLYLSTINVETEQEFKANKYAMVRVGEIITFDNFIVNVPPHIDINHYNSVIVWCESFGEFITSAQYFAQPVNINQSQ